MTAAAMVLSTDPMSDDRDDDERSEHTRLNIRLLRYLEHEDTEPIRGMIREMGSQLLAYEQANIQRFGDIRTLIDGHNWRLSQLEQKANKLEDKVEETGRHQIQSLRAKAKRYEDTGWLVVRATLLVLLGGGVVEFVHRVMGH